VELLALLDKQNRRCPYSGRLLLIGDNASIDHKIPLDRGGTNDLTNLQWVDYHVNIMKWYRTDEEFLADLYQISRFLFTKD